MEVQEAKALLRDSYQKAGLEMVSESDDGVKFRHPESKLETTLKLTDIQDYTSCANTFGTYETIPSECSMCSNTYREQMISRLTRGGAIRRRMPEMVFGTPQDTQAYVEIGPASNLFTQYFRLSKFYLQDIVDDLEFDSGFGLTDVPERELKNSLFKPSTIKIYNLNQPTPEAAIAASVDIANACLFEIAYSMNIPIVLSEEWPKPRNPSGSFRYSLTPEPKERTVPRLKYNQDLIRFYQRGLATDDPVNRFLAFYQVLEYFFIIVADEHLYRKLARRINDPKFITDPKNLDRIIQDTVDHKKETDETEMLRFVLEKYLDENDLTDFIRAYERHLKEHLYSTKKNVFGEEVEVKLQAGHTINNLAKRIKLIRNALVHSSDRHERKVRYIPSVESENEIAKEVPLMKFLAEKTIIASASDISSVPA